MYNICQQMECELEYSTNLLTHEKKIQALPPLVYIYNN